MRRKALAALVGPDYRLDEVITEILRLCRPSARSSAGRCSCASYPGAVAGLIAEFLYSRKPLIPGPTDQNRWAQSRRPMDMMHQGRSTSLFQAAQQ